MKVISRSQEELQSLVKFGVGILIKSHQTPAHILRQRAKSSESVFCCNCTHARKFMLSKFVSKIKSNFKKDFLIRNKKVQMSNLQFEQCIK